MPTTSYAPPSLLPRQRPNAPSDPNQLAALMRTRNGQPSGSVGSNFSGNQQPYAVDVQAEAPDSTEPAWATKLMGNSQSPTPQQPQREQIQGSGTEADWGEFLKSANARGLMGKPLQPTFDSTGRLIPTATHTATVLEAMNHSSSPSSQAVRGSVDPITALMANRSPETGLAAGESRRVTNPFVEGGPVEVTQSYNPFLDERLKQPYAPGTQASMSITNGGMPSVNSTWTANKDGRMKGGPTSEEMTALMGPSAITMLSAAEMNPLAWQRNQQFMAQQKIENDLANRRAAVDEKNADTNRRHVDLQHGMSKEARITALQGFADREKKGMPPDQNQAIFNEELDRLTEMAQRGTQAPNQSTGQASAIQPVTASPATSPTQSGPTASESDVHWLLSSSPDSEALVKNYQQHRDKFATPAARELLRKRLLTQWKGGQEKLLEALANEALMRASYTRTNVPGFSVAEGPVGC